jgi:hypothetical protein
MRASFRCWSASALTDGATGYPEANARHYAFMLEGLAEAERELRARGIAFVIRKGAPDAVALDFSREAALVVCDRGYLKPQKAWRAGLAARADRRVVQVEGDVVVPVETASGKHEVAARTLRSKLHRVWEEYLVPLEARAPKRRFDGLRRRATSICRPRAPGRCGRPRCRPSNAFGGASQPRAAGISRRALRCLRQHRGLPRRARSHMSPTSFRADLAARDRARRAASQTATRPTRRPISKS